MNNELVTKTDSIERALVGGDLSALTQEERLAYYHKVCSDLGLNPITKPFEFIKLNGKLTLYALKSATEQLRKIHTVSITIAKTERIDDIVIVTARATLPSGRQDENIGAVSISGLKGDNLCNAYMKAYTKALRRVTLSICGLGMLDETELETIPQKAFEEKPAQIVSKESTIEVSNNDTKQKGDLHKCLVAFQQCKDEKEIMAMSKKVEAREWTEEEMKQIIIAQRKAVESLVNNTFNKGA